MGRKTRRSVYDPSIMDRLGESSDKTIDTTEPDPLAFDVNDQENGGGVPYPTSTYRDSVYETEQQEILDPKLHGGPRKGGAFRCWLLGSIIVAGLIAIIATGAVIITKNNQKKQPVTYNINRNPIVLDPPPSFLSQVCTQEARLDSNADDFLKCEEGCEVAECCNFPPNFELSCLKNNEQTCLDYHKDCYVVYQKEGASIDTQTQVIQPPVDLNTVCAPNSLITDAGVRNCTQYCRPYECCYAQGVDSCTNQAACQSYAPCLNLAAHSHVDPALALAVAAVCSYDKLVTAPSDAELRVNRRICRNRCKFAECCFKGNAKCTGKEEGFCEQYQACSILYDGSLLDLTSQVDDALVQDDEFVDDDFLDDDNFVDDDVEKDGLYAEEDDEWLDDTYLGDDPTLNDPDLNDAPTDDINDILLNYHPKLDPLPANIDTVCDSTQPISMRNVCKAICDEAKCCNLPEKMEGSCLHGNHLLCLQYHRKCADFESPNQNVSSLTNIPNPPPDLLNLCSPFSLSTETGYKQCYAQCVQAKCCYSLDEGDSQCRQLDKCNLWAPCVNLRAQGYVSEQIQSTVAEKCSEDKMTTIEGRNECQQVCLQHTCCNHNGVCKEQNPTACAQYEPCTILFDEQGNPKPLAGTLSLPSTIANDCSTSMIAAGSRAQCSALCQKGDCCKIPSNLETSCLIGNEETCASFHRFCSVLESNIGTQESTAVVTFNPAPAKLSQWCSPNSLASSTGRDLCQQACEPAKCCWSTAIAPGESCRSNQLCPDYRWCLHLAAASTVNQAVTSTVGSVCTLASIREPGGLETCRNVCDIHSCCWDGNYIPNDDQGLGFEVDDELIDDQFRDFVDDSIDQVDDEFFDDAFLGDDPNAFDPTDLGGDCFDPDVCEQFAGCVLLQGETPPP